MIQEQTVREKNFRHLFTMKINRNQIELENKWLMTANLALASPYCNMSCKYIFLKSSWHIQTFVCVGTLPQSFNNL